MLCLCYLLQRSYPGKLNLKDILLGYFTDLGTVVVDSERYPNGFFF